MYFIDLDQCFFNIFTEPWGFVELLKGSAKCKCFSSFQNIQENYMMFYTIQLNNRQLIKFDRYK